MSRPLLVLSCLLVGVPASAHGESALFGSADASVGGGHDSNMFLQISPDVSTRQPAVSGWFGSAAPSLGVGLSSDGWRFDLTYGLDYRGSEAAGHLALQELELAVSTAPIGRLRPTVSGSIGRFDVSSSAQDRFTFWSLGASLRFELSDAWRAMGSYELDTRTYPGRANERDLVHSADLRLGYHPSSRFELGRENAYVNVSPASVSIFADSTFRLVRFGPDCQLTWQRLSVGLSPWAGTTTIASQALEWQVGGRLVTLLRLGRNLDLLGTVDLGLAPWAEGASAPDYERLYFGIGVVAHAAGRTTFLHRKEVDDLRPVVRDGGVRFRMHAPRAMAVEVVGSWDDWASPGATLNQSDSGLWEGWLDLPPGTHRYRFLVDGKPVRPPKAPRYQKDDFGGEDAVIDIPGQPGREVAAMTLHP